MSENRNEQIELNSLSKQQMEKTLKEILIKAIYDNTDVAAVVDNSQLGNIGPRSSITVITSDGEQHTVKVQVHTKRGE